MSNVTAPAQIEELIIPNPSISADKWNFPIQSEERVEKTTTQLGFLVTLFGAILLLRPLALVMNEWLVLISFFAIIGAGGFLSAKVAKAVVAKKKRDKEQYRYSKAAAIIDSLKEHGWRLWNPNLKNPVDLFVEDHPYDTNIYLVNADNIRYYTMQFYIGKDDIHLMMRLSDAKIEEEMKEVAKQERIAFLTKIYEKANGVMSSEKKAGFVAALEMTL